MHAVALEPDDDAWGIGEIILDEMLAAAVCLSCVDESCDICVVSEVWLEVHCL